MNKLILLFLCLIISKTSAELLVKDYYNPDKPDIGYRYILGFDPIPIKQGETTYYCHLNMDKLKSDDVTLCVPSYYNDDCRIRTDDETETQEKRPNGCLTLDPVECSSGQAINFIFFTDEQVTELKLTTTEDPNLILKICLDIDVITTTCTAAVSTNDNTWKDREGALHCPVPTSEICADNEIVHGFESGIPMCKCSSNCECPSATSKNIPNGCKVDLEQGTCMSNYYRANNIHHDIECEEMPAVTDCLDTDGKTKAHCVPTNEVNCAHHPDFYYIYGAGTSQESKRCCPDTSLSSLYQNDWNPNAGSGSYDTYTDCMSAADWLDSSEARKNARIECKKPRCIFKVKEKEANEFLDSEVDLVGHILTTKTMCMRSKMDHIPGGCPSPHRVAFNGIYHSPMLNIDNRQPCEDRGNTVFSNNEIMCCPFPGAKMIPTGCPIDDTIGGTCKSGNNPVMLFEEGFKRCVSTDFGSSSATISDTTTSQELLDANIPLETLEAAFEEKGGVVLDANTTTAQLGAVSAAKLKSAYQSKGTCQ